MLLIALLFGALQIDTVQTFFARRLTAYLSTELNARVNIDKVSIRLIKSVVLSGLYVEDQHGDTLIYVKDLDVSISDISTSKRFLEIKKLTVKTARFNLKHRRGDEHDNLYFLTSYFSSSDTSAGTAPWKVRVNAINLLDMQFVNNDENDTTGGPGVNFNHLNVSDINGEFNDLSNLNDSIFVNISRLRFREKSGFTINEFSTRAKIASDQIVLHNLIIRSPKTDISTDLTFFINGFESFNEFTKQVHWETDFRNSIVSFTDIAYFATDLWGIEKSVKIEGKFKGSVNNFKGKNVYLSWGERSFFKGSVSMNGLPQIDNTYMDITASEIRTDKQDVEWFPVPPFDSKAHLVIPDNMNQLGSIRFKGKFTGFVSDFVAYGNLTTAIGSVSSDLNFKYDGSKQGSFYSGRLSAYQFDAGKIVSEPYLGKVSFSADVKGRGLKLDNINAKMKGGFTLLEYKNYSYHNISVNGELAKRLFSGELIVNDPNADFDFRGSIDLRNKLPEFHFVADIRSVRLDTLNLFKTDSKTVLQATMRTYFAGSAIDDIVGGIEVDDINFQSDNKLFHINEIRINSSKTSKDRKIDITSDNLDAHFQGQFELLKLGDSFKEILPRYLPSVILPTKSIPGKQDFVYDINVKNLNVITETFFSDWSFAPSTTIRGNFNSMTNDLKIDFETPFISYKKFVVNNLNVQVSTSGNRLSIETLAERVLQNNKNFIIRPEISASAENNRVAYDINLANLDTLSNRAVLKGNIDFSSASVFDLTVDTSNLIIEKEHWLVSDENKIHYDTTGTTITGLILSNGSQTLSLDGKIGKSKSDRMFLNMSGFDLRNLNSFLFANATILNGFVTGDVGIRDPFGELQLETDLKISDLAINNDTIGNALIKSVYNNEQKVVNANVSVIKGTAKIIDIEGEYFINKESENLDFNIKLNNLYLHPVERYLTGIMNQVYGKVSADLKLTGSLKEPLLNGMVDLRKVSLVVDYLNTHYSFSSTVVVKDNDFLFNAMKVYDTNSNQAVLNGRIYHNYFKDFRFDVQLQAEKFQTLNTTVKDNSLYYGIANATGYAHFFGPINSMNMEISLAPEKGTKLNIPLNSLEDLTASNFITFIKRTEDSSRVITRGNVDLTGVNMTLNLEMNRNADINIIFDEKIGDIISGSGTGNIRLEINPSGAFNMYGAYNIEKGDYLFTLKNLINKKFKIDSGGTITWSGDPYKAIIDVTAVYVVYTSTLYNVLPTTDESLKSRLPVDLKIHLTNFLMNPTINYEIDVRELRATEAGMLKTILNSEQELNRQMLGLLVFNQFVPSSLGGQTAAAFNVSGAASAGELLSNQLTNWLGQASTDVTIGFNYRAKDSYSSEEYKILVSKSFIDDRLTVEGDVGVIAGDPQAAKGSSVVGDFYANYKLSKDGRFRLRGFNRSNANNIINYQVSPYTQGIGFMYRKEFNALADLLVKNRQKKSDDLKVDEK